ncbi:MAG: anaerobic magnesium-protoporphyrin IX monomethyl ester cyclase [Myxococcota bacterium]|jgi:anaerobic magnesium-protoporphyrin IX monomethyl ester cyclase
MSQHVMLVNPRATDYPKIQQKSYAPLNLMYIAACLEQAGHRVEIVDLNATLIDDDEVVRVISAARADVYAFPYFSEIAKQCLWLSELCAAANPDCTVVMGGPGASPIPVQCLEQFAHVDAVVRGEGEWTMTELVDRLDRQESLHGCLGVTFRADDGALVHNGPRPVETDLDRFPAPARHLVADVYERGEYYALLEAERPVGGIVTSRGCPFSCGFCYNTVRRYRMRSPESIIEELTWLHEKLGVGFVEFNDILFTANKRRAERVFELMIAEKLPIRFAFKARAPELDDRFVSLARDAGAVQIGFGIESGVQEMLDRMMKKTTVEQCARGVALVRKYGLRCHTGFVLGYPGETPDTIRQTVDFILKTKPTTLTIDVLLPYPDTPVYHEAKANGTLMGEWAPDMPEYPWVKLPWVRTREDLEKARAWAMNRVFFRPFYAGQFVSMIAKARNRHLAKYMAQETKLALFPRFEESSRAIGW